MSSTVRQVGRKVSFLSGTQMKASSLDISESICGQWRKAPPEGNVFSFFQKHLECIEQVTLWKIPVFTDCFENRVTNSGKEHSFSVSNIGKVDLPNVLLCSQRKSMAELHSFLFLYYHNPSYFSKIELNLPDRRGL